MYCSNWLRRGFVRSYNDNLSKFFCLDWYYIFFCALYIKFSILKCPTCGFGGASPQWSKNKTIHCPKCGGAIEYDK